MVKLALFFYKKIGRDDDDYFMATFVHLDRLNGPSNLQQ